ncbi:MAG TPA: hypothetical protein VIR00_12445, partial [Micromonosporaceae bacterium]
AAVSTVPRPIRTVTKAPGIQVPGVARRTEMVSTAAEPYVRDPVVLAGARVGNQVGAGEL